jgi:hypothetical protein
MSQSLFFWKKGDIFCVFNVLDLADRPSEPRAASNKDRSATQRESPIIPMAQRIIAISRVSFDAVGTLAAVTRTVKNGLPKGDSMIIYNDIGDLVTQVAAILTGRKDCLGMLEVHAHSCPMYCNLLTNSNVDAWGQALMKIVWCDNASLYLAGCNTGCTEDGPGWDSVPQTSTNIGPIAEALRDAMAYDSSTFPIHLTVYGSKGYLGGTHITGTEEVEAHYFSGHFWWREFHHRYAKSRDGTGAAAWDPYNNW